MQVYPIKFKPILKEKIWGGQKLSQLLNKSSNAKYVGESWEISGVEGDISEVANGLYAGLDLKDLIRTFGEDFMGSKIMRETGENFPLLIKFLDARTNLSVQVHPDDAMASKYHNSFGKTEMWYIMDAEENSEIILGMKESCADQSVLKDINAFNVNSIFNYEAVKKGKSYFIPAGEIHAIGAGVLAAEIQQTSDITYRIYDWDRTDSNGNKRELHTELALKAIKHLEAEDRIHENIYSDQSTNLVHCDYFSTNLINVENSYNKNLTHLDSFVIYMCVDGEVSIIVDGQKENMTTGETVLIPAKARQVKITSNKSKLLEVYMD